MATAGNFVPWRDAGDTGPRITTRFTADGYTPANGEEPPSARLRFVSSSFFAVLGARLVAGLEFTDADRRGGELVAIVSQTVAQGFFSNGEALTASGPGSTPAVMRRDRLGIRRQEVAAVHARPSTTRSITTPGRAAPV